ncbi:hypothetical protein [Streptomyces sp. MI02-7b]|uniref:hypothetical protein n=1 Tax=Streptomyces sp. MI02-7b TaxID=462941 RepID=UPI0029BBF297|nr:hypothetical protein [Streptomyces sp. MI02-7b]MDX3076829.1 hypothetical protein [Streptomyces sp. MI02-7b]
MNRRSTGRRRGASSEAAAHRPGAPAEEGVPMTMPRTFAAVLVGLVAVATMIGCFAQVW